MRASEPPACFPSASEIVERCNTIPGACVLDVSPDNMRHFACGAFQLVERDCLHVLGAHGAEQVLSVLAVPIELPQAFGLREELCNLKKCAFFQLQQVSQLERQLSQLASFFHGEHEWCVSGASGFWVHSRRLEALSDARTRAKGATAAASDARAVGKHCCNLPRHPSGPEPPFLCGLPTSLQAWRIAAAAAAAAREDAHDATDEDTKENGASAKSAAKMEVAAEAAERAAAMSADDAPAESCDYAATLAAQREWPEHVRLFVERVVICRGGDKALRIRDASQRAEAAIRQTIEALEAAAAALAAQPSVEQVVSELKSDAEFGSCVDGCGRDGQHTVSGGGGESHVPAGRLIHTSAAARVMTRAMHRRRHSNLVRGALPLMRDALCWLQAAMEAAASGKTQFVAGDARVGGGRGGGGEDGGGLGEGAPLGAASRQLGWQPALCVPSVRLHGRELLAALRLVEAAQRPAMREAIAAHGWPESIASRRGATRATATDDRQCAHCERQFSTLWVHRGCCSECEAEVRASGRCPFNGERCRPAWFCPHDGRCFVCDAHSCATCRLERGDAETVAAVARRLSSETPGCVDGSAARLCRIALDFDRTLCTTRSGGAPIVGKHALDDELGAILWRYPALCEVVTRNGNTEAIRAFLAANGAPSEIPIRTVPKGHSKAEFVLGGGLPPSCTVLMVDDSIAELVEERVATDLRVHRVLFVRALL
jgi:hypothetical protein